MTALSIPELFNTALRHHQAGNLPQAETLYRQILVQQPQHPQTLHFLGLLAYQTRRLDSAAELISRALALMPPSPEALSNLAVVLRDLGRPDQALAACQQALALAPQLPQTHNNFGNALHDLGRLAQAAAAFRQAIALQPAFAEAHNNLGNVLRDLGLLDDAVAAFQHALTLQPNHAGFHRNLGNVFRSQGLLDDALAAYRRALSLDPTFAEAHGNLLFCQLYHPNCGPADIAQEHRRWYQMHAAALAGQIQPHENDPSPERPLRVGFVSPDFRDHVVGRNILPLFTHHDHRQFVFVCYADLSALDRLTDAFRRHADHFHITTGLSHDALAQKIRDERIDILVDLALHTGGGRPLLLARKPAPLQVTFAGYPGTTGLPTVDYRLSDPYLDPPDNPQQDAAYAENTFRLPASFWCFDPLNDNPPAVAPLPALTNGILSFGCLNNFCKVNAPTLDLWARALTALPQSRLFLLAGQGSHRQCTIRFFEDRGIAPERLAFFDKCPRDPFLELFAQIDLSLDTLPYNGHTTSLDSLFMGVPVITLVGPTVVGRAGLSQLTNLGLPEFIARTPEEFVAIARHWAADLPRLAALRADLRPRMQRSPLMDGPGFARSIETAFRQMWRRWCEKS